MTTDSVTIERDGALARVRFDRGGSLNAFDQDTILALTEVAQSLQSDLSIHAVVLTGAADVFAAGIDLKDGRMWQQEGMSDLEKREIFYRGVRLCQAWEDMPQVTVVAMEGFAIGAGCALALACDFRILAENAFLQVPEVKIGLNLQWGALPRLITLVGPAKAKRICLLCERLPAKDALSWGLVDDVAPAGQTQTRAEEWARKTLEMPATTVRMVKEGINATANALHRATAFADADQSQLSGAFAEAVAARDAFANKSKG
ncbi:MAG: enoyl-CoA hydratase/isomerase family protein [Rhodospirillaceae bacterium]|jgi:enoyl-CoA hydratase|nr:enoyl-CoA hydratase/isomerase family protein [Rhodospirillaceae bacterium]MBT5239996.1 enoyl-CoA hydratase/isomerase family protein [Rhodospirillaceae bacterium]MBT5564342.1 enoyl-CoA hydratase/isomerase family protein [Rhodospirillaceae bacterium]MBT6090095.1 enoyl-CoA hydratase/isomerase family protein [Rhodospirillaceae bacterium]MBT7450651.1 enoyl-CoA hydratase/isomerase family protein [Rhodospirillaceae bacterium]